MPQGNTVTLFIGQLPAHWNAEMVHNMLTHLFGPGNYHVIKNQYRSNIAFVTVSVSVVRYMVSGTLHYVVEGNNVWLLSNYRATGGTFQAMTIEIARRHS
jgi:hypothetical protein